MNRIANTILSQLGGNKFVTMTGAKNLSAYGDGLGFKIGRNTSKANWVKITLTPNDEYNMGFYRFNAKTGLTSLKVYKGIYCDQLQELFTDFTGLATKLF